MMSASVGAEGIVLHGSPINQQQVEDFNKYVSHDLAQSHSLDVFVDADYPI